MEKGEDPYKILGIEYTAEEAEIKKAYRKAALKYHPDRQQSDADKETAHDVFAKIAAAYDCLTDPVKRYDWKQANPDPQNKNNKNKNSSSHSSDGQSTTSDPGPAKRKTSSARPRDYTPPPTHHRTTKPSPRPRPPARPNHNSQPSRKPPTNSRRATPSSSSSSAYRGKPTSHNAREDPHAPNTTYRSTPHSKENVRTKQAKKNSKTNTTSYSSTPHSKENPHAPNTTYSGKPLHHNKEDPHAPNTAYSGKPKAKYAKDDLYSSRHSTNSSRSAPPPRRPNTGPPTHTHKTTIPASSKQKVPRNNNTNKESLHDPYQTFERILKQEFPKEYRRGNWRPTSHNSKHATTMVIQASPAPAKNTNAVMSMTTMTQTKPISGKGLEAKTITKILRRDGSVEKVVQASMATTPHQAQRYLDAQGTTTIVRPRR